MLHWSFFWTVSGKSKLPNRLGFAQHGRSLRHEVDLWESRLMETFNLCLVSVPGQQTGSPTEDCTTAGGFSDGSAVGVSRWLKCSSPGFGFENDVRFGIWSPWESPWFMINWLHSIQMMVWKYNLPFCFPLMPKTLVMFSVGNLKYWAISGISSKNCWWFSLIFLGLHAQ